MDAQSWAMLGLSTWNFRNEFLDVIRTLGLSPGQRVVELGCGTGVHACLMAEYILDVIAMDVQRQGFQSVFPPTTVRWVQHDFGAVMDSNSVDHVISVNPSAHVFEPRRWTRFGAS